MEIIADYFYLVYFYFILDCSECLFSELYRKRSLWRGYRLIKLLSDKEKEIMIKITKTGILRPPCDGRKSFPVPGNYNLRMCGIHILFHILDNKINFRISVILKKKFWGRGN